jgi:hypothetical protein
VRRNNLPPTSGDIFSDDVDYVLIQWRHYANSRQVIGDFTFLLGKKLSKCICLCNSVADRK